MSVNSKRMLSTLVYYTLAILALLSAGFFIHCLMVREVVFWAEIVYYVWTGLVIGAVIFDVICTYRHEGKKTSALIIYVLSILAIVMACILYFLNSGVTGLADSFFNLFISVSLVSLITTGFMIATWCVGESLVEHETAQESMNKKD